MSLVKGHYDILRGKNLAGGGGKTIQKKCHTESSL